MFNCCVVIISSCAFFPEISLGAIQIKLFQSYLEIPIGPAMTRYFGCILKGKEKRCADSLRLTRAKYPFFYPLPRREKNK